MRGKKKKLLEALKEQLGIVTAACRQADVSRKSHYQWLKTDPEYKEEVEKIPDLVLDFAENALFKLMKDKNVASIIFYLKTKGKGRGYIEKSESVIEHKGEGFKLIINEKKE